MISVIIPAYNAESYLAEALASVLTQTRKPEQVIVIDDGSTDATGRVAQTFSSPIGDSIHSVRQDNAGIGAARNAGLALADGDFIAFLDADDLWPSGRVQAMLAEFERSPHLDIVFGHMEHFFSPELSAAARRRLRCPTGRTPALLAGGLLAKRSVFDVVGPFATDLRLGEFLDWFMRGQEAGLHMATIPDLVLRRRIHGANTVLREQSSRNDYVRLLHRSLVRRRENSAAADHDVGQGIASPAPTDWGEG